MLVLRQRATLRAAQPANSFWRAHKATFDTVIYRLLSAQKQRSKILYADGSMGQHNTSAASDESISSLLKQRDTSACIGASMTAADSALKIAPREQHACFILEVYWRQMVGGTIMGSLGEHSVEESVVLSRTKRNENGYSLTVASWRQ
jgi:hypothetical protein